MFTLAIKYIFVSSRRYIFAIWCMDYQAVSVDETVLNTHVGSARPAQPLLWKYSL